MESSQRKRFCDEANLQNEDFSGAILEGVCCMDAHFDSSSFRGTDLYWIIAMGSSFRDCDFTDAILRGADLKDTIFSEARLIRTDFSRDNLGGSTRLQGADLSKAIIQNCIFDGAEYDSKTLFPEGFHPDKHGLIFQKRI